jgi:predicted AlkP superfamily pyrophosphatase or phosphodiesterase
MQRVLVIQVAALGYEFLKAAEPSATIAGLTFSPLQTVFPAVTCTAQASFRTAATADRHGMVGNGFFDRDLHRAYFWEQSSALVTGKRIWEDLRSRGGTVGQLFWQQSLGHDSDVILSPAPIHKHGGGMIQDCFSRPSELYPYIIEKIGRKFQLQHYWGPLASGKSTEWVTDATCAVMGSPWAPDLLLTYLPHLDYGLQKTGPTAAKPNDFAVLRSSLEEIAESAKANDYAVVVFGDYAISDVSRAVMPNELMLGEKLMRVRKVKDMQYPDLHTSPAFAMVDHQIAHVICDSEDTVQAASDLLAAQPGVARVLGRDEQADLHINHSRTGDLLLVAEPDTWFAYPWWRDARVAPDYARHVDIHNKPGYDPCELFFGRMLGTSLDTRKVQGSHGLTDEPVAFASNIELEPPPTTLVELATAVEASVGTA